MGKGLPRSLKNADKSVARVMEITLNHTLSVTGDEGAANDGQVVIGDFPEGNILFLGAVSYVQLTGPTSDELTDTFEGDYGIGTAADANSTLGGSDVDIIPSTAIAAATAEVSPLTRGSNATTAMFDNTDGSLEINLNVLIDDANITDSEEIEFTVTGNVWIAYAVLGDD